MFPDYEELKRDAPGSTVRLFVLVVYILVNVIVLSYFLWSWVNNIIIQNALCMQEVCIIRVQSLEFALVRLDKMNF